MVINDHGDGDNGDNGDDGAVVHKHGDINEHQKLSSVH